MEVWSLEGGGLEFVKWRFGAGKADDWSLEGGGLELGRWRINSVNTPNITSSSSLFVILIVISPQRLKPGLESTDGLSTDYR